MFLGTEPQALAPPISQSSLLLCSSCLVTRVHCWAVELGRKRGAARKGSVSKTPLRLHQGDDGAEKDASATSLRGVTFSCISGNRSYFSAGGIHLLVVSVDSSKKKGKKSHMHSLSPHQCDEGEVVFESRGQQRCSQIQVKLMIINTIKGAR